MKVDFEKLKKEVSLPDLFIKLGWSIADGCSRSSPKFTNGNETVVVKKNKNDEYTYWDVHDHSKSGKTVLDLMTRYIYETTGKMPTIRQAGEEVQKYANNMEIVSPQDSKFSVSNSELSRNDLVALHHELKNYEGDFLDKRGISKETLSSPVFTNVFYTQNYKYKGRNYNNTCIELINDNGFQGISIRGYKEGNQSFKGIKGYKFGSIAVSKYDKSRPLDFIFVGESMIDNASHYQLKYLNSPKNVLYISTEGNITEGQIKLIDKLISVQLSEENLKNIFDQVIYIFDNDTCGYRYALKLDGYLKEHKIPDIEHLTTEELKVLVDQLPNTDLPQLNDWNDELKAYISHNRDKAFIEAIQKEDFEKLTTLQKEGYLPSPKILEEVKIIASATTKVVLNKIFDSNKLELPLSSTSTEQTPSFFGQTICDVSNKKNDVNSLDI